MRVFRPLAIGAVGLLFVGCGHRDDDGTSPAAQFTDQGVTVRLRMTDRSATHATLVATFTPQRPGFHLYSVGLPPDGIGGVGRPTKVAVQGALRSAGPLVAEASVRMLTLEGTGLMFPVYPDGPVTIDLPADVVAPVDGRGSARALISYAACSPTECMTPVTDHPVDLQVGEAGPSG